MKSQSAAILPFTLVLLLSFQWIAMADTTESFIQCLSLHPDNSTMSISKLIFSPNNSSYSSVLNFTLTNLRFSTPTTLKPLLIFTPLQVRHVHSAVKCAQKCGMEIRIRSGGHDYEGLSYRAADNVPFVIIDMVNLTSISIDAKKKTAWVQVGATLGQLYYKITKKSPTLAFPAASSPTIGVGGHITGGGWGLLSRKYGLACDNVLDAHMIDVHGKLLDRKSMGEDLFWAIRGGGGTSFGVIIAWKIKLVDVPSTVTVFNVQRTWDQNTTKLVHKWQHVAHKLPKDLLVIVSLRSLSSGAEGNRTMQVSFRATFLGGVDNLIPLMQKRLSELGLVKEDCQETNWIQSIFSNERLKIGQPLDLLLQRNFSTRTPFKAKSDYVKEPMPEIAFEGIYERLYQVKAKMAQLVLAPYGGKMSEISESKTPFPHRAGNIYKIEYFVQWDKEEGEEESQKHLNWIRELYNYVTPYVSKNPRSAFFNYRDLDIGTNNVGYTSYNQASIWGKKYFNNNFDRLVHVKTMVDPHNFFKNEQSIPPMSRKKKNDRTLSFNNA